MPTLALTNNSKSATNTAVTKKLEEQIKQNSANAQQQAAANQAAANQTAANQTTYPTVKIDAYQADPELTQSIKDILSSYQNAISTAGVSMPGFAAPTYSPQYDEQIDDLLNQLLNRDQFEYNEELDPLYQQYKDMYTKQGQLAMEDTMGQAAALTGGYSSTYSQAVGQQMYNAYLNKVQELLPEFYDRAYNRYRDEGSDMKDLYSMYIQRDQVDFQRYQQEVTNAQMAYQAAAAAASMEFQQQQANISNLGSLYGLLTSTEASNYQKYLDNLNIDLQVDSMNYERDWNAQQLARENEQTQYERTWNEQALARELENTQYERGQTAQSLARDQVSAILAAGGTPSASLVSQSGLSDEYVQVMKNYYAQQLAAQSTGSSSTGAKKASNYYSSGSNVVNKTTKQVTSQPDSVAAQILAALYNGEITPSEYEELLSKKEAQEGKLRAK